MKKKKTRKTDRIYLIRELLELWDKISPGEVLKINEVRAHLLGVHDEDFTKKQVNQAMWKLYSDVKKSNGTHTHSAIPEILDRKLVGLRKARKDAATRILLEEYYKTVFEKDGHRVAIHADYLHQDTQRGLLPNEAMYRLITGLDPVIKALLPTHKS